MVDVRVSLRPYADPAYDFCLACHAVASLLAKFPFTYKQASFWIMEVNSASLKESSAIDY